MYFIEVSLNASVHSYKCLAATTLDVHCSAVFLLEACFLTSISESWKGDAWVAQFGDHDS